MDKDGNLFGGGTFTVLAPTDKAFNDHLLSYGGSGPETRLKQWDLSSGVSPGIERLTQNKEELAGVILILFSHEHL